MADLNKILKGCIKQKPNAQRQLYDLLANQLFWTCKRYLKKDEDAEEVLADCFISIFKKIKQLQNAEAIYNWARMIVIRACLKRIKNEITHLYIEEITKHPSTSDISESAIEMQQLLKLVDQLPNGCQTVFKLHIIEGYQHKDIAELLDISIGTSKSQLNVAKSKLQNWVNLHYYHKKGDNEKAR